MAVQGDQETGASVDELDDYMESLTLWKNTSYFGKSLSQPACF